MHGLKILALLVILWMPSHAFSNTLDLTEFDLVFNDEFDTNSLDAQKWSTRHLWGSFQTINGEEQYYVDSLDFDSGFGYTPFVFTGSSLIIRADEITSVVPAPDQPVESSPHWQNNPDFQFNPNYSPADPNYFSGIISSYENFNFTHGYVETRAKVPAGKGLWSAFWLLTSKYVEDAPEIDIMEALGEFENEVNHTLHYFDTSNNWSLVSSPTYKTTGQNFTDSFHTYGLLWEPTRITWFVDGVAVREVTDSDFLISKQSMYLIANLAVGGSWPGSPDSTTNFPADYELDYVRVYRKKPAQIITPAVLSSQYQLMFSDEFNSTTLDASKWNTSYLWGPFFRINNEEQYYVDKNNRDSALSVDPFDVSNGSLKITAAQASGSQLPNQPNLNNSVWQSNPSHQYNPDYLQPDGWIPDYTSGVLTSYDAFKFVHGYVEARIKVPEGAGLWPAFWLLNGYYVGPQPEIDIMELQGELPSIAHHSYHYNDTSGNLISSAETSLALNSESFADDFHTFGVQWDRGKIVWYVDGIKTRTLEGSEVSTQLMYILVNLAVGGNFVGDVDASVFPATMEVDYIRAYQRKNNQLIEPPIDTSAPVISINTPFVANELLPLSPQISGTVFEDSPWPSAKVDISIWDAVDYKFVDLNGLADQAIPWIQYFVTPTDTTSGEMQWSLNTALPAGHYELYVRATDVSGNISSFQQKTFKVGTEDITAPSITITNPNSNNDTLPPSPQLTGTVLEESLWPAGTVDISIRDLNNHVFVDLDGSVNPSIVWHQHYVTPAAAAGNGVRQWTLDTTLPAGNYELYLRATDASNNTSEFVRRIFNVGTIDNTAPAITIGNPSTDNELLPPSPVLSGTVMEDNQWPSPVVDISIRDLINHDFVDLNGSVDQSVIWMQHFVTPSLSNGDGQWTLNTELPEGNYEIYVRATDASNNTSLFSRRKFSVSVPDTIAPVITITNPAINNAQLLPAPQLSGTVFEDKPWPVAMVDISIRDIVNHKFVAIDGTANPSIPWILYSVVPTNLPDGTRQWTLDTNLPAGTYEIYVRAIDWADNISIWERIIFSIGN